MLFDDVTYQFTHNETQLFSFLVIADEQLQSIKDDINNTNEKRLDTYQNIQHIIQNNNQQLTYQQNKHNKRNNTKKD
jgi:ubiquinone biosynthesis protein COQ9